VDLNQEMIAIGVANTVGTLSLSLSFVVSRLMPGTGSFFGAYPLGASIGRSAVNANAGSRSVVAVVVAAFFMMIALSGLTSVFQYIPACALGAIVLGAVSPLLDWRIVPVLWRLSKLDLVTLVVAFTITVAFGVQIGILTAVGTSILVTLVLAARPHTARLGRLPGSVVYRSTTAYPQAVTVPGVAVFRFDTYLFFGNAGYFRQVMGQLARELDSGPVAAGGRRALVLDCASMTTVDASGAQAMRDEAIHLARRGIRASERKRERNQRDSELMKLG
jgi:sulfate transporter 4